MNYEELRKLLELLSFASTISLTVFAYMGLRQLRIMKFDIDRNAAILATNECEKHCNIIIPLALECRKHFKEPLKPYKGTVKAFHIDSLDINDATWLKEHYLKLNAEGNASISLLLNSLEAQATCFIHDTADKEVAFSAIGRSFCSIVEEYYPCIAINRNKNGDINPRNSYNNTVNLYNMWNIKIAQYDLESEIELNYEKLKNLPNVVNKSKRPHI